MAIVTAVITTTQEALPAGFQAFENYTLAILDSSNNVVQAGSSTTPSFQFPTAVAPGTYTMSVQANGTENGTVKMIGSIVTAQFTVPQPVMFGAPTAVTVNLS